MLSFEKLNVCDEIKSILMQYRVDFVFQPIFDRLGEIYGYEALMRPEGKNVLEYIEEVKHNNMLHELELVSFLEQLWHIARETMTKSFVSIRFLRNAFL